jgi:hypothetical protein
MASPATTQEKPSSPRPLAALSQGGMSTEQKCARVTWKPIIGAWPPRPTPQEVHGHDEHSTNHDSHSAEQDQR